MNDNLLKAKETDLCNFLIDNYPDKYTIQTATTVRGIEHSSMVVFSNTNRYFRFSTYEGGDGIDLLCRYHGCTYEEAVNQLLSYQSQHRAKKPLPKNVVPAKNGYRTKRNPAGADEMIQWVMQERNVDITEFVREGLAFANIENEAVFCNGDKYWIVASKNAKAKTKKLEVCFKGESCLPWVFKRGNSGRVFVCEGCFDAISLYALRKQKGDGDGLYIAMGGLKESAFEIALNEYCSDTDRASIFIATDWDTAGENFAQRICEKYGTRIYRPKNIIGKDWSDILQSKKRGDRK